MFEKVNPSHPDKIADRIAGALMDLAYRENDRQRIAVEVLIGHGVCHIIAETSVKLHRQDVWKVVRRISGIWLVDYREVRQDRHLSMNQHRSVRCGDNGIFRGVPVTDEQKELCSLAKEIYGIFPSDGKYVTQGKHRTGCQSNAPGKALRKMYPDALVNPLGDWTEGTDVDTGAVNRKLGSDRVIPSQAEGSTARTSRKLTSASVFMHS